MSFQLPSSTRTSRTRPAWSGMAVMVEAMVLLFFLVTSLAIITRLFAAASTYAREGEPSPQTPLPPKAPMKTAS